MTRAVAVTARSYQASYHGRPYQVGRVRAAVVRHLADSPRADEAVLITSEFAANAVTHSRSAGDFFTVRVELFPAYTWVEVEDAGGEWQLRQQDDRPHGLDLVELLAGPDNWGTETTGDGGRVVWARLVTIDP